MHTKLVHPNILPPDFPVALKNEMEGKRVQKKAENFTHLPIVPLILTHINVIGTATLS